MTVRDKTHTKMGHHWAHEVEFRAIEHQPIRPRRHVIYVADLPHPVRRQRCTTDFNNRKNSSIFQFL